MLTVCNADVGWGVGLLLFLARQLNPVTAIMSLENDQ